MSTELSQPTYETKLRGISSDLSEIGTQFPETDLGSLTAEALTELLEKFAAIEAVRLVDHEPEITLSGIRGRFIVKNYLGKLALRSATDPLAAFAKMPPGDIPAWLDQTEGVPLVAGTQKAEEEIIIGYSPRRNYFSMALMIISHGVLGVTTSYQPTPINSRDNYLPIDDVSEIAALQYSLTGRYTNINSSVEILIEDPRQLSLIEIDGPNNSIRERTSHSYWPMTDLHGAPVLFTEDIGVISILDQNTLKYFNDTFNKLP